MRQSALRRLIRNQRRLQSRDGVLQLQFAFLQALDRQFVGGDVFVQAVDGEVEVAVFQAQFGQPVRDARLLGGVGRVGDGASLARRRGSVTGAGQAKMPGL